MLMFIVPVLSFKWRIQVAASSPTPQTHNRGRRRVCLGLLGAFIPPDAAGLRSEHVVNAASVSQPGPCALTAQRVCFSSFIAFEMAQPWGPSTIHAYLINPACLQHLSINAASTSTHTKGSANTMNHHNKISLITHRPRIPWP